MTITTSQIPLIASKAQNYVPYILLDNQDELQACLASPHFETHTWVESLLFRYRKGLNFSLAVSLMVAEFGPTAHKDDIAPRLACYLRAGLISAVNAYNSACDKNTDYNFFENLAQAEYDQAGK